MSTPLRVLVAVMALALALAGLAGCGQIESLFKSDAQESGPTGQYHNFEDIEVPVDLKIDNDRFLCLRDGRVQGRDPVLFPGTSRSTPWPGIFQTAMVKDGWKLKSTFRYPKQVLLFEKEKKVCIIIVSEGTINTHVEIWVAPSV